MNANSGNIAFFDTKPYDKKSFTDINKTFRFSIKFFENHLNEKTAPLAEGYDTVCAFVNDDLSLPVINRLYKGGTKLIVLRCAGYNHVDLKAVYKKIHVARVPAYSPYAVAEHAAALILTLNRKTHKAYYRVRDNNFSINGFLGFDLHGKTAGVIGTGKIGKILINILLGFGMKVIAYDKFQDQELSKNTLVSYVGLNELYKQSDIISLHCPLNQETTHLINKESINKMKKDVMIINTSRGQLIDTKALITALKQKKIGGAGLDVYEEESEYFFEDLSDSIINDDILARLLTFPNVLVTSHQAFFTKEALRNIAQTTLNNVKEYINNQPLTNEICYKCNKKPCLKQTTGRCF